MTNFAYASALPSALNSSAINRTINALLCSHHFGAAVGDPQMFAALQRRNFDRAIASADELRLVPPGWLEQHEVLLPEDFEVNLNDKREILKRLQHMIHAPRNESAILNILQHVLIPSTKTKKSTHKVRAITSLSDLAHRLAAASRKDPNFIDDLLRGYLGDCIQAIADRKLVMAETTAKDLLLKVSIIWGLYDLQIIACRLFTSTVWPTAGFLEQNGFKANTLDALRKIAEKSLPCFQLIQENMGSENIDLNEKSNLTLKQKKSFNSFAAQSGLKKIAENYAWAIGIDETHITTKNIPVSEDLKELFLDISKQGITLSEHIIKLSNQQFDGHRHKNNHKNKKSPLGKQLHAGSFRYGMRPEVALSYAITTFVCMIFDLPRKIECIGQFPNEDLTSQLLTPYKVKDIHGYTEGLVQAYRLIFLLDSNVSSSEEDGEKPNLYRFAQKKILSREQIRQVLRDHTSKFVPQIDSLSGAELESKASGNRNGRRMIEDALDILSSEGVIRTNAQRENFVRSPPDPRFAPAISWRCSRRRASRP